MYLPPELLVSIYKHLDLTNLKECRLINKAFGHVATALVFGTVYLSFTKPCVRKFEYISAHETLARDVKTIIIRQGPERGYPAFCSYESWEQNAVCSSDDHTMTSEKWANMTAAERKALYDEYENDRMTLRFDKNDFLEKVVRSLKRMPNLSTFSHEPTDYDEMSWKCEWRGLRFYEDKEDYTYLESIWYSEEIEHDIDSLHLALFLQALGSVQPPKSLKTMSFEIYGPGFWTPLRLRHLWEGCGHGKIRQLRKTHQDAATADQKADESVDDTAIEDYSAQLDTLQSIIGRVECIDLNVVESYSNGSLDTIAEPLSRFLRLGKNLKDVTLAYGNFHPYFDRTPEDFQELSNYRENKQDLLAQLAIGTPWSAIATLHVTIATDSSVFLGFLEAVASTLRTLWLDSVMLLPGDRERGTWEYVLPRIPASLPKIDHLLLDNLSDFRTDGSTRKLFRSSDWKCSNCYEDYEVIIVTYLLCERRLRLPLELDMSSDCEHQ
jgi:hypothetical protein